MRNGRERLRVAGHSVYRVENTLKNNDYALFLIPFRYYQKFQYLFSLRLLCHFTPPCLSVCLYHLCIKMEKPIKIQTFTPDLLGSANTMALPILLTHLSPELLLEGLI